MHRSNAHPSHHRLRLHTCSTATVEASFSSSSHNNHCTHQLGFMGFAGYLPSIPPPPSASEPSSDFDAVLSLDPVLGAIAADNAVVLKPSEIAPATSSLLARLLNEYMDNSTIRVVKGPVSETTALLEQ